MRSIGRPGVDLPAQALDQVEVFRLVALGLGLGDGRLAEQIDGEGQRPPAQAGDGRERLVQVRAGDEAAGQPFGVAACRPGQEPADEAVARQPAQAQPQPRRQSGDPASRKYSRRWRVISAGECSSGRTSMKRNSCTLTASSPMVHSMSRSSHQPGLKGMGP